MKASILVLPGDGVGPEVAAEGVRVLRAVATLWGHDFAVRAELLGGCAIDATGTSLPPVTLAAAQAADAILLGAVGGPKWDDPRAAVRPEQGLLGLRRALGLFANLRPVRPHPLLVGASPLRPELLQGVDLLVVRELTGGIYFGEKRRETVNGVEQATNVCTYTADEIARVVRVAARMARERRGKLTSVDKANVLETLPSLAPGHGRRGEAGVPGCAARDDARRCLCHAPAQAAGRFRRDRHREHVRRHPDQ